jgi:biotin carboxylase
MVAAEDGSQRGLARLLAGVAELVPLDRPEPLAAELRRRGVDGAVTFADEHLVLTAELCALLGSPGLRPDVARVVVSKHDQRVALNRAGVSSIASVVLEAGAPVPADAAISYPAVLKPEHGTGAAVTLKLASAAELEQALDALERGRRMVCEPYIPDVVHPAGDWLGNYVSVDSIVTRGEVTHLGVVDRLPAAEPFRESGGVWPSLLPERHRRAVEELVETAIRALGVDEAVTHVEVKLTPTSGVVIEVNARLGGYMHALYTRGGRGDPLRAALDLAAAREPAPLRAPDRAIMVLLTQPPVDATTLTSVPSVQRLRSLPGVYSAEALRRPGDAVDWREGSLGRVLDLWLEAPDHDELRRRADAVQELLDAELRFA